MNRLTWAQYDPQQRPPLCWQGSEDLKWLHGQRVERIARLLRERMSWGRVGLVVVECPSVPGAGGRGRAGEFQHDPRARRDSDGALLDLAGLISDLCRDLGLTCLLPEVSTIRQWAAGQQSIVDSRKSIVGGEALEQPDQQGLSDAARGGGLSPTPERGVKADEGSPEAVTQFDWHNPDGAIKQWFLDAGASQHSVMAKGVLSNKDKRDAMLAAMYGDSYHRATEAQRGASRG